MVGLLFQASQGAYGVEYLAQGSQNAYSSDFISQNSQGGYQHASTESFISQVEDESHLHLPYRYVTLGKIYSKNVFCNDVVISGLY
jgi:hypothetical protein